MTKYIFFSPSEFLSQKKAVNEEECFASGGKHYACASDEELKLWLVFHSYGFYELLIPRHLSLLSVLFLPPG